MSDEKLLPRIPVLETDHGMAAVAKMLYNEVERQVRSEVGDLFKRFKNNTAGRGLGPEEEREARRYYLELMKVASIRVIEDFQSRLNKDPNAE